MAGATASTYDYIVVGAGSAGCAIAARLCADPSVSVLLLEAGPRDRNVWLHIPVGYYRSITNPRYGWGYETEPQPGLNGRRVSWPRGKTLGGTSAINGLVYTRGQAQDFDHWRQLGNTGWSYDDVLPYFRRAEDQARGANAFHGAGGPLGVSDVFTDELCDAYVDAAVQAGIARNDDFNGATQEGVGYFQLTTRNGLRSSAAAAYLHPMRRLPNLEVLTEAHVSRVLFNGRRAVGVAYGRGGSSQEVRARAEIVLAGGAINSPQLLQLSGIGPARLLRQYGLPVVVDSPGVGERLQDHLQARFVYECSQPITVNDEVRSNARKLRAGLQWLVFRTGPLTIGAGHVGVFARTRPELETPDIQIHFIRFSADRPGGSLHEFSGFTVSVCGLRPQSRGSVHIASPDPAAKPVIQPNYLDTQGDRQTMIDGMLLARDIAAQPAFAPYVTREVYPGPDTRDEQQMLAYVRSVGTTIFHPTSTCAMGPDSNYAVDERLRVRGVARLRVADASVMPTVVSANTNATCIMIGEKAAAMMTEDARYGRVERAT
ncbi:MAG: GMC family oxidoreductase [Gammaproteobacteria bacterium]